MIRYSMLAIVLHWLVALLIISGFTLGMTMVDIPGITPTKLKYFSWHKWLGITVLGLACVRLLWRLLKTPPGFHAAMPVWQRSAAHLLHGALYLLMFAIPVSGYLYSLAAGVPVVYLGLLPLPDIIGPDPEWKAILKNVHYWLNMALLAMFVLHVAAALKHHFIDRDQVLRRILP